MLVFTRRADEAFHIGDDIVVRILSIDKRQIRVGIDAPKDVKVHREEVMQRIENEREETAEEVA